MLSQTFSASKLATRIAFLLPVLALCIYFFNQEIVAKPVVQQEKQTAQKTYTYENKNSSSNNKIIKQKDLRRYVPNLGTDTLEKSIPTSDQLADWQNATKYGVWIDGKPIENSVLATKSTSDFDQYFVSKLEKNARTPEGTSFQVNLMTPSYYEKHKVMDAMVTNKQIQEYLTLKINIQDEKVSVNGKSTSLSNFAKTIDEITADWTKEDMMGVFHSVTVRKRSGPICKRTVRRIS